MISNLQFARRTAGFQESVIREMTRLGDDADAVNLSQGLPDFNPPDSVLQAAIRAITEGENQYTFPFGLAEFRQAVAEKCRTYNHFSVNPETEITITCGVSEAIMSVILGLTEPGDEVIIFEPWYENYIPDCQMAGVKPHFVSLHEPDYSFDTAELRAAFNDKTRLIFINTPHNPTGKVFSREELQEIASLCQEFGVIAVTDEIYEHIYYDKHEHISLGSLDGMQDRTVTISGLGKTYAVTGWRIGWAAAHKDVSALIRKVHDYLTVCAPAPFQKAGITALALPQEYYSDMRLKYAQRREIMLSALSAAGFRFTRPGGAYYIMADFSEIVWDEKKYARSGWSRDRVFAEYIARDIGVAVVPGSSFYMGEDKGTSRVRFNFAKLENTMLEASRRLARF